MAGDPDGNPEQQATFWVGAVTGLVQPEGESLQSWLKSGVVLCELVEKISPGCAGKTSSEEVLASKPQLVRRMKEMENITNAIFSGTNVKKFQCLSMTKHSIERIASFTHPQTDLSKSNPKDVRVQIKKNPMPNMGIWAVPDM